MFINSLFLCSIASILAFSSCSASDDLSPFEDQKTIKTTTIENLPNECLVSIFLHLDYSSLYQASLVNKNFRQITIQPEFLQQVFGINPLSEKPYPAEMLQYANKPQYFGSIFRTPDSIQEFNRKFMDNAYFSKYLSNIKDGIEDADLKILRLELESVGIRTDSIEWKKPKLVADKEVYRFEGGALTMTIQSGLPTPFGTLTPSIKFNGEKSIELSDHLSSIKSLGWSENWKIKLVKSMAENGLFMTGTAYYSYNQDLKSIEKIFNYKIRLPIFHSLKGSYQPADFFKKQVI